MVPSTAGHDGYGSETTCTRSSVAFGGCFAALPLIEGEFHDLFITPMLADKRRISGQARTLLGIDWALLDSLKIDQAKITAPVLLVWGEEDPVFPVEEARPMAAQLGNCAGFVTIPKGKLFVHEEMPEAVLPILLDSLLSHQQARAVARAAAIPAATAATRL